MFEIFCEGDGRINEANMSSALHFLLNPKAPHGFGVTSLEEFLSPITNKLEIMCSQRHVINPYRIFELGSFLRSFHRVEFNLEEKVFNPNFEVGQKNNRDIDLVIKFFSDLDSNQPSFIIAIENKISEDAASEDQIAEEYQFLREKLDTDYPSTEAVSQVPVIFIYLTPKALDRKTNAAWSRLLLPTSPSETGRDFKVHYSWQRIEFNNRASIVDLATSLLKKEQSGGINPVSSYSSLFLRSMLNFIRNDFRTELRKYQEESDKAPIAQMREEVTQDAFWLDWKNSKEESLSYAKMLYTITSDRLLDCFNTVPRFSKTRVAFYVENTRYCAILLQGKTTKGRVEIHIRKNEGRPITEELQNICEMNGIEVADVYSNIGLTVPITASIEIVSRLIFELIQKKFETQSY